ncbi:hypothetical protein VTK26DRAFT_2059 [Humicola hyalothermophila]
MSSKSLRCPLHSRAAYTGKLCLPFSLCFGWIQFRIALLPGFRSSEMHLAALVASLAVTAGYYVQAAALRTTLPHLTLAQAQDGAMAMSTCGYLEGDPSQPWIAPKGFNCRVDTAHGIWGFCPTTVIAPTDCGLGAYCFDAGPCSTGCGRASLRNNPKVTTWTCPEADDVSDAKFCSIATLIFGPDQSYDYVDCARGPGTATYFAAPTAPFSATPAESSSLEPTPKLTSSLEATRTTAPASGPLLSTPLTESNTGPSSSGHRIPATTDDGGGAGGDGGGDGTNNNTGAIVGGILGGLALVLGSVIVLVYLLRHNCARTAPADNTTSKRAEGTREDVIPSSTSNAAKWKYYAGAGWGPGELPADTGTRSRQEPAELPAYRFSRAPLAPAPVELPVCGR